MSADPAVVSTPEPKSAGAERSRGRGVARILSGEWPVVAATFFVPLLLLVPVLRLWRMNFRVPMVYWGDATFYLMLVKDLIEHGSYLTNPSLGAPFGQQLYDFPQGGDNLNILVLWVIGLFTKDAALTMNLFYLLTYPIVALSALLVLRRFGMSRTAAFVCAVLFTMLPYHFLRGEGNVFLSAYWAVPLGAYLTLVTLDGGVLFARREGRRRVTRWLSRTTLGTLGICLVVGSTGLYYGAYAVLLVLVAAVVAGVVKRSRRVFLSGLAAALVVAGVLVANLSPSAVYSWSHGKNTVAVARQPIESEAYGLKMASLLLPVDGHRIGVFARASRTYSHASVIPENGVEAGQAVGTIGDVGFLALLLVVLASCVSASRWRPPALLRHASFAMIVAFLFGTVSGFSVLFAYVVTPDLHVPGRICVFIAFFSLLAVGVLIDAGARRFLPVARRGRWLIAVAVALVLIGVADQTTNAFVPDWSGVKQEWRTDASFGHAVERALPRGSKVFELPYQAFPGYPPPGRILVYDGGKPYLHTTGIEWSFGSLVGRPANWSADLSTASSQGLVPTVAAAGFNAIYVDRYGYADGGRSLERILRRDLGAPVAFSNDGRYALYDLREYRQSLEARMGSAAVAAAGLDALYPVTLTLSQGFYGPESNADEQWQWSAGPAVELQISNPAPSARSVVFSTRIAARVGKASVEIAYPDGSRARLTTTSTPRLVRRVLTIPPGVSDIDVESTASPGAGNPGDPRTLYLQFVDTHAVGTTLARLSAAG